MLSSRMPSAIEVWTARVSYRGRDRLDISRKSGDETGIVFARSWELLGPYLALRKIAPINEQDWQRYTEAYTQEMRTSYRRHRTVWEAVLEGNATLAGPDSPTVTLCCYCNDPSRCHRTILAGILGKLGASVMAER